MVKKPYISSMNDTIMFILFNPISCVMWFFVFGILYGWWIDKKK